MMNPPADFQVYDPPMCCSTGVCGPEVDPALAAFSGFLAHLRERGFTVERYNLAQEPLAFVRNSEVRAFLDTDGADRLPMHFLRGRRVLVGRYPDAQERISWARELGAPQEAA